jgi:centractin
VPAVYVAVQGVLSLFETGKSTGIVLDSGDGVTHVIPVYEGYSLAHSCERMDLAGRDVTAHLQTLLRKSGINLNTSAEFELARSIKEKYCAITVNQLEKARDKKDKYTLPDGQQVEFTNNEKEAGEIMFQPDRIGLESPCNHN